MAEPRRVGVVCGGQSAEREVSLKTGQAVADALLSRPVAVTIYDTTGDLGDRLRQDQIDVVFIALHGRGGEDGVLQGMLEWNQIPYTGPGVAASAICIDKIYTKYLLESFGLPTPNWFVLGPDDPIENRAGFDRLVVKPRSEGSSIGLSVVEPQDFAAAVTEARNYDSQLLIEQYIEGYELTVGALELEQFHLLPPVGIRPAHQFFDFATKYTKGLTEYDVPAKIDRPVVDQLAQLTREAVKRFGTERLCRVDYILARDQSPYILEINTIPGLTATSLLPMAAAASGIEFDQLIWGLIMRAMEDNNGT